MGGLYSAGAINCREKLEVQALDEGSLLFGFANSGLMTREPGEKKGRMNGTMTCQG